MLAKYLLNSVIALQIAYIIAGARHFPGVYVNASA